MCARSRSTSCQDTGLTAGTTYTYSIRAVIGAHWQSPAVSASATTLGVTTTALPSGSVGATYTTSLSAVGGNGSVHLGPHLRQRSPPG